MKGRLLIILVILTEITCNSQIVNRPFIIESRLHAGINLPFYKALDYLIEDDLFAGDLMIRLPATGKDHWEKLYHYPSTGFGYSWWSLGNREVLGSAHAFYGFMSVPLNRESASFRINIQTSAGYAYIPKKFDLQTNHLNRAIGSSSNIYIRLGFDIRKKITPGSEIILEAGTSHFSNGKTHSPNYGINTGSFSVGLNCFFNREGYILQDPAVPEKDKRLIQTIFLSAGRKVYDNLLDTRYLSSTLSYDIGRFVTKAALVGVGADAFYDGSISEGLAESEGKQVEGFTSLMRIGIHGSYALRYKRAQAGLQAGWYLYSKYRVLTNLYTRLSIQYSITNNICTSVIIRSHFGKADALEYGLGYTW